MALTKECIPILHQMEQVSTDEHVGSLAETVLESLKGHPEAEARVKEVRDQTKVEKKKLAMAMRAKQLKVNLINFVKLQHKLISRYFQKKIL